MAELTDDSLVFCRIKLKNDARELVRHSRTHRKLTEGKAARVAEAAEVRAHRPTLKLLNRHF